MVPSLLSKNNRCFPSFIYSNFNDMVLSIQDFTYSSSWVPEEGDGSEEEVEVPETETQGPPSKLEKQETAEKQTADERWKHSTS